jgi:hypothetical protein
LDSSRLRLTALDSERRVRVRLWLMGVWSLEPIPTGTSRRVVVEQDAAQNEARGSYTLKLWAGEAGAGGANLDSVTFP